MPWEAYHVEGDDTFEGYLAGLVLFYQDLVNTERT